MVRVALRKESVDRNEKIGRLLVPVRPSLSARRAWIEITRPSITRYFFESLSARRAWIEIYDWLDAGTLSRVALRKESVDRNLT